MYVFGDLRVGVRALYVCIRTRTNTGRRQSIVNRGAGSGSYMGRKASIKPTQTDPPQPTHSPPTAPDSIRLAAHLEEACLRCRLDCCRRPPTMAVGARAAASRAAARAMADPFVPPARTNEPEAAPDAGRARPAARPEATALCLGEMMEGWDWVGRGGLLVARGDRIKLVAAEFIIRSREARPATDGPSLTSASSLGVYAWRFFGAVPRSIWVCWEVTSIKFSPSTSLETFSRSMCSIRSTKPIQHTPTHPDPTTKSS